MTAAPVDRVFERRGPLLIRSATTISRFRLGAAVLGLPVDVAVRQALIGTSESPRPAHAFPLRAHAGSPSHALEAHGPPRRQGAAARLTCRRRCHHHSAFAYCHQPTIVLMSTAAGPPRRSQRRNHSGVQMITTARWPSERVARSPATPRGLLASRTAARNSTSIERQAHRRRRVGERRVCWQVREHPLLERNLRGSSAVKVENTSTQDPQRTPMFMRMQVQGVRVRGGRAAGRQHDAPPANPPFTQLRGSRRESHGWRGRTCGAVAIGRMPCQSGSPSETREMGGKGKCG